MKHSELAGPKHDAIDKQIQALKDQIKKATDDMKGKTGSQRQNMIRFKETRQGMLENLQKKKAGIPARASLSSVKESAKLRLEVAYDMPEATMQYCNISKQYGPKPNWMNYLGLYEYENLIKQLRRNPKEQLGWKQDILKGHPDLESIGNIGLRVVRYSDKKTLWVNVTPESAASKDAWKNDLDEYIDSVTDAMLDGEMDNDDAEAIVEKGMKVVNRCFKQKTRPTECADELMELYA